MEKDRFIHILLIICIISLLFNIYQAHRENTLYNIHNEACHNLMIEQNCIDNISLLQDSYPDMDNVLGEAWQINNEVVYK